MKLQTIRKLKKMSQAKLAAALSVTQGAVSQWESGMSTPRTEKLPEIARILGCEIKDLFEGDESER
jgi:transcriptional regulator with XRE-family HTH domain